MVAGYTVRVAGRDDVDPIAALLELAFEGDRVARLAAALRTYRAEPAPIELVAQDSGGRIVGHAMLSTCLLDAPRRLVPVMTLSPLAVDRSHRGKGIGGWLIRELLALADQHVPLVFIEGDPGYYRQYGFQAAGQLGFRRPSLRIPEPAFQVMTLTNYESWMDGTFVYSEPFWALDCVGLRDA